MENTTDKKINNEKLQFGYGTEVGDCGYSFLINDCSIHAHKKMLAKLPYFKTYFTGNYKVKNEIKL